MRHLIGKCSLTHATGCLSPIGGYISPEIFYFDDDFATGDFSKWEVTSPTPFAPYGTIVTDIVYSSPYAAKLWTNDPYKTPWLIKLFGLYADTMYFHFMLRFFRMPTERLYYVATLGTYRLPWVFYDRQIWLDVWKYDTKYYWAVDGKRTTTEVSAGVWYEVQLMSSRSLGRTKVWIDDVLLKETVKSPLTMNCAGYMVYPTVTPINDGFYVDDVKISEEGPIEA